MALLEMLSAVARQLLNGILLDYRFLPVYIILAWFIKIKYDKYREFQSNIYGKPLKTSKEIVEEVVFVGLVMGFIVSIITVASGITLNSETVKYLFFIIVVLGIINIKYIRFSYAAGILAIMSLVFGLHTADITSLLIISAMLNIIESILIYINAGKDSFPVFIKHEEEITGAFLIHKVWPVPFVFFTFVIQSGIESVPQVLGSDWKAFLASETISNGALALGLDSIIAVTGYSDIAITRQPERKTREMAVRFFSLSLLILATAVLSANIYAFKVAGALLVVFAHEGVLLYGHYRERHGKPLFRSVRRGVKVFDILPGSHADKMGMQRGDIILNINGRDIQTEDGIAAALNDFPTFVWVHTLGPDGSRKTYEYRCYPDGFNQLGIVSVPREKEVTYNADRFQNMVILKNLVARFRRINKSV